jgi:hypothetical protein
MDQSEARDFIAMLYPLFLKRRPSEKELEDWTKAAVHLTPALIAKRFSESAEFKKHRGVETVFPAGHFFSPIVNPDEVREYVEKRRRMHHTQIPGIVIDVEEMWHFWNLHERLFRAAVFPKGKGPDRFHYDDSPFPQGDAITLYAMLGAYRPRKVIEIGSGFSTACMLDSADRLGLDGMEITCIEPYPSRLKSFLRPHDYERVRIIESPLQSVPVERVVDLSRNDILFIDSTHVLKTGSDVHYELFEILPALAAGVLVHVHDCHYPFEYPQKFIFERNYSWNEIYALRAFLMYNDRFKIILWGSLLERLYRNAVKDVNPHFLVNPGGSIWLGVQPSPGKP